MKMNLEDQARHRLARRGYLIHDNAVWYIVNDDTDQGLEEVLIGGWTGLVQDAFNALEAHGFPTDQTIICGQCKTNEVEFIGDVCYDCNVIQMAEERGETVFSQRRER